MSDDKSKNKNGQSEASDAEEVATAERSRIADVFGDKSTDSKVVDSAKETAKDAADSVVETTKDIASGAAGVAGAALGVFGKAKDLAVDAKDSAVDLAGDVKDSAVDAKDSAVELAADAKDTAVDMADDAKDAAVHVKDGAVAAVASVAGGTKNAVANVADGAKDVADGAKEAVADVASGAKDAVANAADGAKEAVANVADGAKDAVANVAGGAKDVADGAIDAVGNVADGAKDAVANVAGGATDFVGRIKEGIPAAIGAILGVSSQQIPTDADGEVKGIAAFFNHPDHLMYAAEQANAANFEIYDAYSPFPIHGMDDAMGLERSWLPWVTFGAGATGFCTAFGLQFGIMGFDWPMVFGGRPFIAWPSFVPILFELTVLFAGVTTAIVMLIAAGCFRKPFIIDKDITNDQFVLWISAEDKSFEVDDVIAFMKKLNPHTIRAIREGQK